VQELQARLRTFMEDHVLPTDAEWHRLAEAGSYPLKVVER